MKHITYMYICMAIDHNFHITHIHVSDIFYVHILVRSGCLLKIRVPLVHNYKLGTHHNSVLTLTVAFFIMASYEAPSSDCVIDGALPSAIS